MHSRIKLAVFFSFICFAVSASAATQTQLDAMFNATSRAGEPSLNELLANNLGATSSNAPRKDFAVSHEQAEKSVAQALSAQGMGGKITAMMDGRNPRPVFAYHEPVRVECRGLTADKQRSRWQCSMVFINEYDQVVSAVPSSGYFREMVALPVLKRQLRHGDMITEDDIELRDFAINQVRPETVQSMSEVIGRTPAQGISAYRPLRTSELTGMPLVRRNDVVQLQYVAPGMLITTTGVAINQGAKGDVIEVRNTNSKKIIRGIVQEKDIVSVIAPQANVSQLSGVTHAAY